MTRPALASLAALTLLLAGCGAQATSPPPAPSPHPTPAPSSDAPQHTLDPGTRPVRLPADPTTVDRRNPDAVAAAVAVLQYRVDTTHDHGWSDAARRSTPLLSPGYAADIAHAPTPAPDAEWATWTRHQAATTVASTPLTEPHPPDSRTRAARAWTLTVTPRGRDGWRGAAQRHTVYVLLTRTNGEWAATDVTVR